MVIYKITWKSLKMSEFGMETQVLGNYDAVTKNVNIVANNIKLMKTIK